MSSSTTPTLRRRAGLVLAGLAVSTVGATALHTDVAAAAGKAKVTSTISLAKDSSKLAGKLKSSKKACKAKKDVNLFWLEPGKKKYVQVAQDQSSNKGAWQVPAPGSTIPAGKYYVKIAGSKQCKPEKSKTIGVR